MEKKIVITLVLVMFISVAVLPALGRMNYIISKDEINKEKTSLQKYVNFYGSDDTEGGITEFYNDISSEDVILAHSTVKDIERFYIIPPGHWIDFFPDGSFKGDIPFDFFDGLLHDSKRTIQKWIVLGVKNVKKGKDPSKDWSTFGTYVKVNDVLTSCTYFWIGDYTGWLKYSDGTWITNLSYSKMCITKPHHIPYDPIFCNINGFSNYADCRYGVVEGGFDLNCETEGYTKVTPDYQPGYQGSFGEAFIPQRYDGPFPPHKPLTPDGPPSGSPGNSYTYISNVIDPNGDEIYYMYDWGDGTMSDWFGPSPSGDDVSGSHIWSEKGTYNVKLKARDISGLESEWSDSLPVTIPRNRATTFDSLLMEVLEHFPLLGRIINLQ